MIQDFNWHNYLSPCFYFWAESHHHIKHSACLLTSWGLAQKKVLPILFSNIFRRRGTNPVCILSTSWEEFVPGESDLINDDTDVSPPVGVCHKVSAFCQRTQVSYVSLGSKVSIKSCSFPPSFLPQQMADSRVNQGGHTVTWKYQYFYQYFYPCACREALDLAPVAVFQYDLVGAKKVDTHGSRFWHHLYQCSFEVNFWHQAINAEHTVV